MIKREILFIIGNSGSGKTYIANQLSEYKMFYKMRQYTTRKKRDTESDNEYYFINKEHYDLIKDKLITATIVNGEYYGTVPVFEENRIGMIVVNKMGLENGLKYIEKEGSIDYRILYLKNTEPFEKRESRNAEFVKQEMEETKEIVESLDPNKIIEVVNNPSNRVPTDTIGAMICKSFKKEFKLKEKQKDGTKIECPFVTCRFNSGFKCSKDKIKLSREDVYLKDDVKNAEDMEDIKYLKAEQTLTCEDYRFNPYWHDINGKKMKRKK